ncbi:MAG: hypothetical protein E7164_01025 [Firmicutes bacterium]|nr:hypothetical protein [Bacillota bacterium]
MNLTLIIMAIIILIIGIVLYYVGLKQKKNLEANYTIKGTLIKYKRIGRYLHPIIEFTENGKKKEILKGGTLNYKPLKVGSEIKILKKENGKYLTDSDVKFIQYYAISLMLTFILLVFISFVI